MKRICLSLQFEMKHSICIALFISTFFYSYSFAQKGYDHFKVAVYMRAYEVNKMADLKLLDSLWNIIEQQVHVDKVYIETHRDLLMVQQDTLNRVKNFFKERGIKTSGGITLTVYEPKRFQTFCYSNPQHRKKVKEIVEYTARNFDEVILDDFFFTNCKCELCINAKGQQSWTDYRLKLMEDAARELVVEAAKAVNSEVRVIIKYPNWYAHFQGLGFNLEAQPPLFDGIYTGNETRDAFLSAQHLQPYHGYSIFRYFENSKPGGNDGGWVDTGGSLYLDRYSEQLWLTLFAGAPEITLFDFRQLLRPLSQFPDAPWQGKHTSFDVEEMKQSAGTVIPSTIAGAAGYVFEKTDPVIGELGNPVGIKCYRPHHSVGEDFLPSFLGMAGLPIELVPYFPAGDSMILLTASAAFDPDIVPKIRQQLLDGKSVTITSGLLKILQDKGLDDIAELRYTGDKAIVNKYAIARNLVEGNTKEILIPQIKYLTNDSWEIVYALNGPNGWPILHEAEYAKGSLFVLTIPDNYADLSNYPEPVLNTIRAYLAGYHEVQLQAPGNVSIFMYDNHTFIVESFCDDKVSVKLAANEASGSLIDLLAKLSISGEIQPASRGWSQPVIPAKKVFQLELPPHSYKVLRLKY
ncbi:MAG: hypothetical protein JXB24_10110 [Bacteroidales bacterium]|nr:hypothetical protein [Bacteroidales bacterium]